MELELAAVSSLTSVLLDGTQGQQVAVVVEIRIIDTRSQLVEVTKTAVYNLPHGGFANDTMFWNGHVQFAEVVRLPSFFTYPVSVNDTEKFDFWHFSSFLPVKPIGQLSTMF